MNVGAYSLWVGMAQRCASVFLARGCGIPDGDVGSVATGRVADQGILRHIACSSLLSDDPQTVTACFAGPGRLIMTGNRWD